ncbi:putative spindle assembly checkpoint kinase [Tetrabaena socialis]|uniref:Putative spindle assembly checkpoint kinase n=1 Tax=Tetrabaena socialis TaxID=47790 RepID=A0A2J8A1J2_9CHLO|nr:putative spindle assembly checkpoint kinase [Tetrabaena socialis]|eukprot:PNH06396.1 putative spindle assembly checkpoint kinase [Tetrabaena socialis]
MATPQRSAGSTLNVVDEFVEEEDEEGAEEERGGGVHDAPESGKTGGKLAGFFKSLFKSKDKDKESASSSKRSSATNSATKQGAANAAAASPPTISRPSPPTTPSSVDPALASPLRSRSTHAMHVASPPSATSRLAPSSNKPSTANGLTADGAEAAQVSPAAARTKSITLKAELRSYQHSKSFTELSQKARVVPKRGNEILIASPIAPPRMQRADWSLKDYAVVEKMYKGYASSVYKAFCKRSGELVCLKAYDMAALCELNRFQIYRLVPHCVGYASSVYKAFCKRSGELVCLKAYDMAALCELNRFQIYREVQLHGKLSHQNVIGLYGAFQVDSQVVMVQEFADGGDLFTLLHRYGGRMPERQAVEMVLLPCLRVLVYLHEQGILHRDIKPENILFTRNMTFKLCDFGLAIDLRDERAVTRAGLAAKLGAGQGAGALMGRTASVSRLM